MLVELELLYDMLDSLVEDQLLNDVELELLELELVDDSELRDDSELVLEVDELELLSDE